MPSRILILILVLALAGPVFAETGGWECHGPWGGLSLRIVVDAADPDRALVSTARGYRFTADAGQSWATATVPGGAVPPPMDLVRGRIWCSYDKAIRSSSDGVEWKSDGPVQGTAVAFGEASGGGPLFAVAAVRGKRSTVSFRVLAREDLGWTQVAAFTEAVRFPPAVAVRGHPDHGKVLRVFLTGLDATDATITYGSDDGGKTWRRWLFFPRLWDTVPLAGPGVRFGGLALHPALPPKGLFLSEDGATSWKPVSTDARLTRLRSIAVGPGNRLLLGSTREHLLDTTPKLETVKVLSKGLVNESVSAVAIHPAKPKRIWAGTQCGLFLSDDGGETFAPASTGFAAGQFRGLAVAGPRVLAFEYHQGLRVSEDGARTWKPLDLAWRTRYGKAFRVVGRGDTIAASTGEGRNDWRITISRDGGKTWSMQRYPEATVATGIGPGGEVYVTRKSGALLRAAVGLEFEVFATGFAKLGGEVHSVQPLAGGKRLLLLGGVGAATCDAKTGKDVKLVVPPVTQPLRWPEAALDGGDALYVSDQRGRLFRRDLPDGVWENVTPEGAGHLIGVVADPGVKGRRVAAFANGLVTISADGGRTWRVLARFGSCAAMAMETPRRLHVAADGAVRSFDLSKIE